MKLLIMQFSPTTCHFICLRSKYTTTTTTTTTTTITTTTTTTNNNNNNNNNTLHILSLNSR
jgi:hypothetical protein